MATLAERAVRFERFLDGAKNEDGIIYSDVKADELRAWRDEDLIDKGYDLWDLWLPHPAEHMHYEDCIMAMGRYVGAKILKHLAAGGDEPALKDAEAVVRVLLAIARQGDRYESGYLPKPYGGLHGCHESRYISSDQYEHALFAFRRFRKACPGSELIPEIESSIIKFADYFIRHDFTYVYFGRTLAAIEEREAGDLPVGIAIHGLGLFMPLMHMAAEISGERKYEDVLTNRLIPRLLDYTANRPFAQNQNTCNLLVLGLYYCRQRGYAPKELTAIMEMLWRLDAGMLSADGLGYDMPGVTDDDLVEPHYRDGPPNNLNFRLLDWVSSRKTAHSCKTAHSGALIQRVHFTEERAGTIQRILDHYQEPGDFLRYVDFDGRQVPREYKFLANTIPLQFPGAWLEAYYLTGLPREKDGL